MGRDHYHAPPQRADLPGYGQSLFAHDRRFDHSLHRFASVKGRNGGHPPRPGPLFNSLIATRSVSLVKARGAGFEPAKCGHTCQVSKPLGVRGPFGLAPSTKLGHPRRGVATRPLAKARVRLRRASPPATPGDTKGKTAPDSRQPPCLRWERAQIVYVRARLTISARSPDQGPGHRGRPPPVPPPVRPWRPRGLHPPVLNSASKLLASVLLMGFTSFQTVNPDRLRRDSSSRRSSRQCLQTQPKETPCLHSPRSQWA